MEQPILRVVHDDDPQPKPSEIRKVVTTLAKVLRFPIYYPIQILERHVKLSTEGRKVAHILVGLGIAAAGVVISKQQWFPAEHPLHLSADYVGYFLHGLGVTPLAKHMLAAFGE